MGSGTTLKPTPTHKESTKTGLARWTIFKFPPKQHVQIFNHDAGTFTHSTLRCNEVHLYTYYHNNNLTSSNLSPIMPHLSRCFCSLRNERECAVLSSASPPNNPFSVSWTSLKVSEGKYFTGPPFSLCWIGGGGDGSGGSTSRGCGSGGGGGGGGRLPLLSSTLHNRANTACMHRQGEQCTAWCNYNTHTYIYIHSQTYPQIILGNYFKSGLNRLKQAKWLHICYSVRSPRKVHKSG